MTRCALLERERVGASFLRWPRETRFITPSFTTNGFGMPDMNAVTPDSSPALGIRSSHLSGEDYARYLTDVASALELPVRTGVQVLALVRSDDGFEVATSDGPLQARFVVWAGGELSRPRAPEFPGGELCVHTSRIQAYAQIEAQEPIVIGGFESGLDAAIHLARLGKRVRVLDPTAWWETQATDPSLSVSPYTMERLVTYAARQRIELLGGVAAHAVERAGPGSFLVHATHGSSLRTDGAPILANGFAGSVAQLSGLFALDAAGVPAVSEVDESTLTPGLFRVGPQLRHRRHKFCFIYKFRQRFAVVAAELAQRLGLSVDPLQEYADASMWLDDLSCCDRECLC